MFPFSCACAHACVCTATSENEIPLSHNTSTRIFTTRGCVWSVKPLDPDYRARLNRMILFVLVFASNFVFTIGSSLLLAFVCLCLRFSLRLCLRLSLCCSENQAKWLILLTYSRYVFYVICVVWIFSPLVYIPICLKRE